MLYLPEYTAIIRMKFIKLMSISSINQPESFKNFLGWNLTINSFKKLKKRKCDPIFRDQYLFCYSCQNNGPIFKKMDQGPNQSILSLTNHKRIRYISDPIILVLHIYLFMCTYAWMCVYISIHECKYKHRNEYKRQTKHVREPC